MGRAPISLNCALTCASGLTGLPLDLVSAHQLHCHFHHFYPSVTTLSTDTTNLLEQVHRFWEVEEPPAVPHQLSEEDHFAERFYMESTSRLPSGRYQVCLPFFKNSSHTLGNSLKGAMSRFFALERKFASNSQFKSQYVQFITDYVAQGHMSLVSDPNFPKYFIPVSYTHLDVYKRQEVKQDTAQGLND